MCRDPRVSRDPRWGNQGCAMRERQKSSHHPPQVNHQISRPLRNFTSDINPEGLSPSGNQLVRSLDLVDPWLAGGGAAHGASATAPMKLCYLELRAHTVSTFLGLFRTQESAWWRTSSPAVRSKHSECGASCSAPPRLPCGTPLPPCPVTSFRTSCTTSLRSSSFERPVFNDLDLYLEWVSVLWFRVWGLRSRV